MRNLLIRSAVSSGLLLFGLTAVAQDRPSDRFDRYYDHDATADRARFFDHVRADLDRAEESAASYNGDLDRIAVLRDQLSVFQRRIDTGNYDQRGLTDVIVSVQRVLDHNALYDRTRDNLTADLSQLREMRSIYDGWR